MHNAERTEEFDISCEDFYKVIVDYASYPEFVDGVSDIEVLEQDENGARVKYYLKMIKEFSYVLKMKHNAPAGISWTLESGDIFKVNEGYWNLEDLGNGKTKVTYGLGLDFKMFAPKPILKKLVSHNLPNMMQAYYDRAKQA